MTPHVGHALNVACWKAHGPGGYEGDWVLQGRASFLDRLPCWLRAGPAVLPHGQPEARGRAAACAVARAGTTAHFVMRVWLHGCLAFVAVHPILSTTWSSDTPPFCVPCSTPAGQPRAARRPAGGARGAAGDEAGGHAVLQQAAAGGARGEWRGRGQRVSGVVIPRWAESHGGKRTFSQVAAVGKIRTCLSRCLGEMFACGCPGVRQGASEEPVGVVAWWGLLGVPSLSCP